VLPRLIYLNIFQSTFPLDTLIDVFPFKTHGLEKFIGILEIDLLPPRNDIDQSEDGIVKVVDLEGVDEDGCL
jgi:hypothetical protein